MIYIKKYESFVAGGGEPQVKPKPTTAPTTTPSKSPSRPSPIRRDKPSVDPDPKAKKKLNKASVEALANRFVKLSNERGEDIKKYYE